MRKKNPHLRIEGSRVYLRYPTADDGPKFTSLAKASSEFHKGLASPATEPQSFDQFVEKNASDANECLLIGEISSDSIAGAINLSQIFYSGFQNAYLGYYLFEGFIGRGLMTEALRLILKYSFDDLELHRLEANIQPENLASIRLVSRCGFVKEGHSEKYLFVDGKWRDHERWAIIRENWEKNSE